MSGEEVQDAGAAASSSTLKGIGSEGDVPFTQAKEETPTPDATTTSASTCNEEFLELKKKGNELFQQSLFPEAIQKYEDAKGHATSPDDLAMLFHNIGFANEKMDDSRKALEAYNKAINLKDNYIKVLKRRARLLNSMGKHKEAMDDMVEVFVDEIKKNKHTESEEVKAPTAEDLKNGPTPLLIEILLALTQVEARKILANHKDVSPPTSRIECSLRPFYGDPVARMWKGLDPSPVDEFIAEGKAEDLRGYMAALRDLKLKKYDKIVQHCTDEIDNPSSASPENVINARFLRGTMSYFWSFSEETLEDLKSVAESPDLDPKIRSSAYLRLGMSHSNYRTGNPAVPASSDGRERLQKIAEAYASAEEMWPQNPDIFFYGSMLLVDRGQPDEALFMLENKMNECEPSMSILVKSFYWTMKMTVANDEEEKRLAYNEIRKLEPSFDIPEQHEMFAQALLVAGRDHEAEYYEQFEKAIAYSPDDPLFKVKKLIFRHWMGQRGEDVKIEEALNEMYEFVENSDAISLAYFHIGQLEIVRGNIEKGIEAMNKSIELSGCIIETEARLASRLELEFHLRVNERLKEEGLEHLTEQLSSLSLKTYPTPTGL